tara:strand:- start:93 stop:431 length:339 start_codon:yes stop_codon:yes gene_type:complete
MQTLEKTGKKSIDWAAGIFEGEGCIKVNSYYKGKPYYAAQINMTDADVLEEFHKTVGLGNLYGPYPGKKNHYKPMYQWLVTKKSDLKQFLELLLPQLCHRRAKKAGQVLRHL